MNSGPESSRGSVATGDREVVLAVTGVEIGYEAGAPILSNVSLSVHAGDFLVLTGANGSGKTTLLKAIAGLLGLRRGRVVIGGHERDSVEARADMSFVGDTPVFYDGVSIGENLDFLGRLHGIAGLPEHRVVSDLGVDNLLDRLPNRASRGQRQRAFLAMGLARPWRLALLDEPTIALDADARRRLGRLLSTACRSGRAVVVASHDPELIAAANRTAEVVEGRLAWPAGGGPLLEQLLP